MPQSNYILKSNPLTPAEDYEAMRKSGFQWIEQLGSDLWTDYNTSDPGITILEALIYALTDLGYRSEFDIKDLLAPKQLASDTWNEIFYTAKEILHAHPLTVNDYRKLIIDIEGVRNAWFEPSKEYEVPIWVDYTSYKNKPKEDCACTETDQPFCLGNLSLNPATAESVAAFYKKKEGQLESIDELNKNILQFQEEKNKITNQLQIETDPLAINELKKNSTIIDNKIQTLERKIEKIQFEKEFITEHQKRTITSKILEIEGLYNVMIEYEENILEEQQKEEIQQKIVQRLQKNRNLAEDFLSVTPVEYIDFGVGASIVLEEDGDPDQVAAQIFFILYRYFTPSIAFHTISEMIAKGFQIDEVFEGPALMHGFIEEEDLRKTELFKDIRLSDLINEMMNIKGIKAITFLHLPFYGMEDKGNSDQFFNQWVQQLQQERKVARVKTEQSVLIFCKENEFITFNTGNKSDRDSRKFLKLFADLKNSERKYKLKNIDLDLPIPRGENMELEDYFPVTYSLPQTYGVSERAGLPANADEKRKIQALQLKGYLLFFEQLLSDYLVQLNHLREIFTMDETPQQTYFTKALKELQDFKLLILNDDESSQDEAVEKFGAFIQNLAETPQEFLNRRNTILNHLLARFNENMEEYESLNHLFHFKDFGGQMLEDKINMLKNKEYLEVSCNRGKGYDYADVDIWDSLNISGLERRVGRLLGFQNIKRRSLVPEYIQIEALQIQEKGRNPAWTMKTNLAGTQLNVIHFLDPGNEQQPLLTSVEVADGCCTEQLINDIIHNSDIDTHVKIKDSPNRHARKNAKNLGNFWFEIYDGPDEETSVLLAESFHYEKIEERDAALKSFLSLICLINEDEGMHLIEHLLLRPRLDEVLDEGNQTIPVSFLDICLDNCDLDIGLNEGELPLFRKKISRIPAEKCYDQMPWILEYFHQNEKYSFLFQKVELNEDLSPIESRLKFKRYIDLVKRIEEIRSFGTDRNNYSILSNDAQLPEKVKYSYVLKNENGKVLAQSLFIYDKLPKNSTEKLPDARYYEDEIILLQKWFNRETDWYCQPNPCDNNEDPYSFRTTVVLPCWPKRFRNATFKNFVEKTIDQESPAHIHTRVIWLGLNEMKRFEDAYYNWLEEMSLTEIPSYEKVNPLVDVLNTLQSCGECKEDCTGKKDSIPSPENPK